MGLLISFEGIDGCGKSTQIKLLHEKLNNNNIKTLIFREPGDTSFSNKIRDILLDNNNEICSASEMLLFLSARAQLVKELEPGLNALFGLEYDRYEDEHAEIFDTETSDRAFEEEVMLSGFDAAPVKSEGAGVAFDTAQESFTARYTNETVALAFSITEEAIEDNLYDRLSARYTRALARSMSNTKQIKAASVLNNAFNSSFAGGDGKELCATDHPTIGGGNFRNELSTAADLNETSLEQALIDIAAFIDERGLKVAVQGTKLIIPKELQFTADRLLE